MYYSTSINIKMITENNYWHSQQTPIITKLTNLILNNNLIKETHAPTVSSKLIVSQCQLSCNTMIQININTCLVHRVRNLCFERDENITFQID